MSSEGTTVELSAGPPPVLTKRATSRVAIARLRAEAAILAAARHPGVVSLVDLTDEHDESGQVVELALTMRVAGSRTLANAGAVSPRRAAGLIAALAATVSDLHRLGIVHGRITADHVVLAGDSRPVLCGFAGGRSRAAGVVVGNRGAGDGGADDVAGLGSLLRELVQSTDEVLEAPPARRLSLRGSGDGGLRAVLLNLADHATADEPNRRPTAAQFADAIRTAVPDASFAEPSTRPSDAENRVRVPRATRPRMLIVGAGLVLALVAGIAGLSHDDPVTPHDPQAAAAPPAVTDAAITSTSATTSRSKTTATTTTSSSIIGRTPDATTLESAAGCVTDDRDGATVVGEPCPVRVRYEAGVLDVGDRAFELGLDSAAAAIGDFGCTGQVVPAVLDLATGDLFVFDRWATTDAPVQATATTQVPSARQLLAEPAPPRCHRLVVLDEWGIRHPVTPEPEVTP